MSFFRTLVSRLAIGPRLAVGFGLLLCMMLGGTAFGLLQTHRLGAFLEKLHEHPYKVTVAVLSLDREIIRIHRSMKDAVLANNPAELSAAKDAVALHNAAALEQLTMLESRYLGDLADVTKVRDLLEAWTPIRAKVLAQVADGDRKGAALTTQREGAAHAKRLNQTVHELETYAAGMADRLAATAASTASATFSMMAFGLLLCLAAGVFLTILITQSITQPLSSCVHGLGALAQQKFEPVEVYGQDEIAEMATALNSSIEVMRDALASVTSNAAAQAHNATVVRSDVESLLKVVEQASQGDLTVNVPPAEDPAVSRISEALTKLLGSLRRSMSEFAQSSGQITDAAHQVTDLGTRMGEDARATTERSTAVSSAVSEVSEKIQTVSERADDLVLSVQDISDHAGQAADVAGRAVQLVQQTDAAFDRLRQSSQQIGQVIKLITTISEQTNLLALNATIEAASAGDAGRGFSVVAAEVKALANASAKAAEQVAQQIMTIQADTVGASESLSEINQIINQIDSIQGSITTAVQDQSTTTSLITLNMGEAAGASSRIVTDIRTVSDAASDTTGRATASLEAARDLSLSATNLQRLVGKFRYKANSETGPSRKVA